MAEQETAGESKLNILRFGIEASKRKKRMVRKGQAICDACLSD